MAIDFNRKPGESAEEYRARLKASIAEARGNVNKTVNQGVNSSLVPEGQKSRGVKVRTSHKLESIFDNKTLRKMNDYTTADEFMDAVGSNAVMDVANQQTLARMKEKNAGDTLEELNKSPRYKRIRDTVANELSEKLRNAFPEYNIAANIKQKDEREAARKDKKAGSYVEALQDADALKPGEIKHKKDRWFNDDGRHIKALSQRSLRQGLTENAESYLEKIKGMMSPENYAIVKDRIANTISAANTSRMSADDWRKLMEASDEPFTIYPTRQDIKNHTLTVHRGDNGVWRLTGPKDVATFMDTVPYNKIDVRSIERSNAADKLVHSLNRTLQSGDQAWFFEQKPEEKSQSIGKGEYLQRYLDGEDLSGIWKYSDSELAKNTLAKLKELQPQYLEASDKLINNKGIVREYTEQIKNAATALGINIDEAFEKMADAAVSGSADAEKYRHDIEDAIVSAGGQNPSTSLGKIIDSLKVRPDIEAEYNNLKAEVKHQESLLPDKVGIKEILLDQLGVNSDDHRDELLSASEDDFRDYLLARKAVSDASTSEEDIINIANALTRNLNALKESEDRDVAIAAEREILPLLKQLKSEEDGTKKSDMRNRITDFMTNLEELKNKNPDVARAVEGVDFKYNLAGSDGLKQVAMNENMLKDLGLTDNQIKVFTSIHNPPIAAGSGRVKNVYAKPENFYKGRGRVEGDIADTRDNLLTSAEYEADAQKYAEKANAEKKEAKERRGQLAAEERAEDKKAFEEHMANAKAAEKQRKATRKDRDNIKNLRGDIAKTREEINDLTHVEDKRLPKDVKDRFSDDKLPSQIDTSEYRMTPQAAAEKQRNLEAAKQYSDTDKAAKEAEKKKPLSSEDLKPIIDALNNKW